MLGLSMSLLYGGLASASDYKKATVSSPSWQSTCHSYDTSRKDYDLDAFLCLLESITMINLTALIPITSTNRAAQVIIISLCLLPT
jgi:hypothetical protein